MRQGIGHQKGYELLENVLMGLLRRILDDNKRVQEAACSAFATLEEEAAEDLAPRLEIILKHLMIAFGKYQRRNLRIVYDAIGTLAEAVGGELNQPAYLDILMPPLIEKWHQLPNSDKDLFPLFECFTSIAHALGTGFTPFAEPVFRRCINIIQTQQFAKVSQCSLSDLLLHCCVDDAPDIRQSAFALLGDLARVMCPIHLHPHLCQFLKASAKQLESSKVKEAVSVANNACWAIGELAVKVHQEISPIVLTVISCLVPVLQHVEIFGTNDAYSKEEIDLVRNLLAGHLLHHIDN
ncbi:hypothetical protein K1719_035234 [Acacia pycnantha]|nr:hypothetical protein K1719_035234 [Acacia pycnantha]